MNAVPARKWRWARRWMARRLALVSSTVIEKRTPGRWQATTTVPGVDARVGPQGQRPAGAGGAHPADRLGDEAGRPAGGVGAAAAQLAVEQVPGAAANATSG
jgi:hypothetical protein